MLVLTFCLLLSLVISTLNHILLFSVSEAVYTIEDCKKAMCSKNARVANLGWDGCHLKECSSASLEYGTFSPSVTYNILYMFDPL